jgi:hypothetical protein
VGKRIGSGRQLDEPADKRGPGRGNLDCERSVQLQIRGERIRDAGFDLETSVPSISSSGMPGAARSPALASLRATTPSNGARTAA